MSNCERNFDVWPQKCLREWIPPPNLEHSHEENSCLSLHRVEKQSGRAGGGELEKYTDWPRTSWISKHCLHFLDFLLIFGCKYICKYIYTHIYVDMINCCNHFYYFLTDGQNSLIVSFMCIYMSWLTHRAEGAHPVAALLPCKVVLIAYGAHTIGSWVAIETAACGTQHGHRALVRLLGHC